MFSKCRRLQSRQNQYGKSGFPHILCQCLVYRMKYTGDSFSGLHCPVHIFSERPVIRRGIIVFCDRKQRPQDHRQCQDPRDVDQYHFLSFCQFHWYKISFLTIDPVSSPYLHHFRRCLHRNCRCHCFRYRCCRNHCCRCHHRRHRHHRHYPAQVPGSEPVWAQVSE